MSRGSDRDQTKAQLLAALEAARAEIVQLQRQLSRSMTTAQKQAEAALQQQSDQQKLVVQIAQRIRESLNLTAILKTTATEVRQLLQTDRVIIFQFDPQWRGRVVVEAVGDDWTPILSTQIYDPCFHEHYIAPFQKGIVTAKADIYTANISECHLELLSTFQVRANLVVPILQGEHLWGLLIAHHCAAPRPWQDWEIDLLRQLATQVGIAIQQSTLFHQLRVELQERQRTEAALRQSEERWQLAIDGSNEGIWDYDLTTSDIFLSPRCREILDFAENEIMTYEAWLGRIHPEDMERVHVAFQHHLNRQQPYYEAEYRWLDRSGDYRWLLGRGKALWDQQGKPIRVIGSLSDISDRIRVEADRKRAEQKVRLLNAELEQRVLDRTAELSRANQQLETEAADRRQAELALRESEARFRSAFDHAATGMALIGLEGQWLKVNLALCEILGYPESALRQTNCFALLHPEDYHSFLEALQPLLHNEQRSIQHEKRFQHKLGHFIWIRLSISCVQGAERGEVGRWEDGGMGRRESGGRSLEDGNSDLETRNSVLPTPYSELGARNLELRTQPLYFVAQLQDITQSRAVEQLKREFISIVSHELRTPLTSIRGSLGLLATGILNQEPEQMQRMIGIASSETERLVRLVNDILDLDRLESGRVPLARKSCRVVELIQRSIEIMQASAQAAEVTLASFCEQIESSWDAIAAPTAKHDENLTTSLYVWADPDRITQTLTNLLSNAIKFSPPGGRVCVRAELVVSSFGLTPQVRFQVKDHGRGIPSDKLETVFGRFQQVDASDSRQKGGTGLGLAICRSIVHQHGGQIWVESSVGEGSIFWFTLPSSICYTDRSNNSW